MRISRDLIMDVQNGIDKGGRASQSSHAMSYTKLVLITALLEKEINESQFDELIRMSDTPREASAAISNNPAFDNAVRAVQGVVGATTDGRLGHGTLQAVVDYVSNKRYPGQNMEVGSPSTQPTADMILGGSGSGGRQNNNFVPQERNYGSSYTPGYGQGPSPKGASTTLDATDKALMVGGGAALAAAMETQAQLISSQVMGAIAQDAAAATSSTVGAASSAVTSGINNGVAKLASGVKDFLMGTAADAETGRAATSGIFGKLANMFKNKQPSEMVLPIAVVMAIGLGGAFGWRRYLKHRKNQRLARELARDTEMRRQFERMLADSGMSKYSGQPEAIDAVRAVEMSELRQPYMRGY